MPSIPKTSAAEFLMRLIPAMVYTLVCLLALTSPAYSAFAQISFSPSSPTTAALRMTKKAVILVVSSDECAHQISVTVLTNAFKNFLYDKKYGTSGTAEFSSSRCVAGSVSVGSRCSSDALCDFTSGLSARYFLVSMATRTRPLADSLMGRWWLSVSGTCLSATIRSSWYTSGLVMEYL